MSNEITLYERFTDPVTAIEKIGGIFAKCGFVGADRLEQGEYLAIVCMAERKSPVEIIRNYDIVMGKLRKKAIAAFADFRGRGGKVKWLAMGDDGKAAEGEFAFEGQTLKVRFTIEDAKRQGVVKAGSAWEKTPGNMLRARCLSNAIGMLCPEVFAGDDGESEAAPGPELKLDPAPANVIPVHFAEPKSDLVNVNESPRPAKTHNEDDGESRNSPNPPGGGGGGATIDVTTVTQTAPASAANPIPGGTNPEGNPASQSSGAPAANPVAGAVPSSTAPPAAPPSGAGAGELVSQVATLCAGNFLGAARVMMKERRLPQAELKDEAHAAAYMEANLPNAEPKFLVRVLRNAESFLGRAAKELAK